MARKIEDYAMIGDCKTAALVARDGSIDWLCWPRFDSPACIANLVGTPDNGCWKLAPVEKAQHIVRRYRKNTLILETEFQNHEGTVALIDFMPVGENHSHIVRLAKGVRGKVHMQMDLTIRFDYGRSIPWVRRTEDGSMRAVVGPDLVTLRTPVPFRGENLKTVSQFTLNEGETIPFVLSHGRSYRDGGPVIDAQSVCEKTEAFWKDWSDRCTYGGPYGDAVRRSLIILKALTYLPTGGIVASPTTSLPEQTHGRRNWDYRFCWLRDATFALLALMHAGYHDEAVEWQNWLLRAIAGSPDQLQILYGVAGERHLPEWEAPWLAGFNGASPVRIGNAASGQLQLDIYGELADAWHQAKEGQLPENEPSFELHCLLLEHLEKIWREPDAGMWEVRGPNRHFTHSKVMAWVAFDRVIRRAEKLRLQCPIDHWRAIREQIHAEVCRQGFHETLGSFVQSYGSSLLDASLLLIPLVGFLPPSDPRVRGTLDQIERRLLRDHLVQRYRTAETEDGLPPGEGVFLACSFWLADNYILQGRKMDAENLFRRLLSLRNDVGLLSEEYDPGTGRLMGNFPQAFSHVALVNTALNLQREHGPAHQRSRGSNV